jgi:hypothetical protein
MEGGSGNGTREMSEVPRCSKLIGRGGKIDAKSRATLYTRAWTKTLPSVSRLWADQTERQRRDLSHL